jgi:hypothetical protein
VINALTGTGTNSHTNINGHLSNGSIPNSNRKNVTAPNQTKFAILIASPKIYNLNESSNLTKQRLVKSEIASPPTSNGNDQVVEVKKEKMDDGDDNSDDEDASLLSRLISYLTE